MKIFKKQNKMESKMFTPTKKINIMPENFNHNDYILINVPFPGFYETILGDGLNDLVEYESQSPEDLGFDFSKALDDQTWREWCNDLYKAYDDAFDWSQYEEEVSKAYLDVFNDWICENTEGLDSFTLIAESIESPQYYNYSTDRLFAYMPIDQAKVLYNIAFDSNKARDNLEKHIRARFTSCDGFISGYSNNIDDWESVPFDELDHNHWGTLLQAFIDYNKEDINDFMFSAVYYDLNLIEISLDCFNHEKIEKGMNKLKEEYKNYTIKK